MIIPPILCNYLNYFLLPLLTLFISCHEQNKPANGNGSAPEYLTALTETATINQTKKNSFAGIEHGIRSIFQDRNNNYWFGTNEEGVYRYDGKTLIQFTEKDGLFNNQVQSIQEDRSGNIWFGTGLFGVSRFDGSAFTTFTDKQHLKSNKSCTEWKIGPDDLWFYAGGGVYRYNGSSFNYLPLPKMHSDSTHEKHPADRLGRYAVYSILKDKKGNLWIGTQAMGVCRYNGTNFKWFTEKGLASPAVLGLFEDKKGNLWFGNNGYGLFRYDGTSLVNITEENNLTNKEFLISGKQGPGTLARIYSINEDNENNIWIGTVDAGVWRYDGKTFTNFTKRDGLTSNAVNTIYKDRKGELWFGTDADGICKFNGKTFTKFTIN